MSKDIIVGILWCVMTLSCVIAIETGKSHNIKDTNGVVGTNTIFNDFRPLYDTILDCTKDIAPHVSGMSIDKQSINILIEESKKWANAHNYEIVRFVTVGCKMFVTMNKKGDLNE